MSFADLGSEGSSFDAAGLEGAKQCFVEVGVLNPQAPALPAWSSRLDTGGARGAATGDDGRGGASARTSAPSSSTSITSFSCASTAVT